MKYLRDIGDIKGVVIEDIKQIDSEEYSEYPVECRMLVYDYTRYKEERFSLPDNILTVALTEYYTPFRSGMKGFRYLRKPFDIFQLYRTLFAEQPRFEITNQPDGFMAVGAHVAVVDDNKVNLKVAVTQFKEFGVLAEAYKSGIDILKVMKAGRKFDLIFMDHMMPEMDGVETTKRIREMDGEYFKRVPIVALTANAISGVEREYLAAGMNDWMFKPIKIEQLKEKLMKYLPEEKKRLL